MKCSDKPDLPEIEHLRGKITDEQLEAIKDILERNEEVFSRHKADIGCCNFVEHEIELEENAAPHREGARRMTPHKSDACRKEIETLLEYDMIEPSKSPWACGVVMAKTRWLSWNVDGGIRGFDATTPSMAQGSSHYRSDHQQDQRARARVRCHR